MGYFKRNSKNGELKIATLISKNEITKLGNFLSENFNNVAYKGSTKDGTIIRFVSLEDFLSYPNFDKRSLIGLNIECENDNKSLELKFYDERYIFPETIKYSLRYDNTEWGFSFEDELNERLKEFKPWYSILTCTNLTYGLPAIGIIIILAVFALDFFTKQFGYSGFLSIDYNSNTSSNQIVGYILWIPILICSFLINKLRDYLFPLIFIAIGKQKKVYENRQKLSYVLFGVIGLGIAINILSSLLIK